MELRFSDRYGVLLCRTATHIYLRPHPDLSRRVAHYTLHLGSGAPLSAPSPLVLVPDASGCLVFTLEGDRLFGRMYGPSTAAVSVVNDLRTRPFRFLVEFLPGALAAATHIPQWELADRVLPLALTAPGLDGAFARLWRAAPDLDEFIAGVDALLLSHLAGEDGFASLLTLACRREGVQALAAETGYSPRHLSRLFRARTGMGPKVFARVVRVNRAAAALQAGPCSLTRLAQDLGYFDQSHFDREFRAVCGVSPSAFRAGVSDFYKEPWKL